MADMKADKPKIVKPKKPKVVKPKDGGAEEGLDSRLEHPTRQQVGVRGPQRGNDKGEELDSRLRGNDKEGGINAGEDAGNEEEKPDAHILTGRRGMDNKIRMRLLRGRGYLPTGSVVYATTEEADAMEADGTARRIDEQSD